MILLRNWFIGIMKALFLFLNWTLRYHYGDGEMNGYVRFTLSKAPADNWVDDGRV